MTSDRTRIFISGHQGMVGSAIVRQLKDLKKYKIITRPHLKLDLVRQDSVEHFFAEEKIDQVYLAAGKVGGIYANNHYPAEFIYENLMIECNIVHAAHQVDVQKLLFLGSSCIYPKLTNQPMSEKSLLSGLLEPTNEPYAIAKIAGIKLCESYNRQYGRDYRSVMPTNLYGMNDNFHPENSHVIPALLRRFHKAVQSNAKEIVLWGSGKPKREFLHVDDMAAACVHIMELDDVTYQSHTQATLSHINIGSGLDCSIYELAEMIAGITNFKGKLVFDADKPDGTPRKLLDVSRLKSLGWKASIDLEEGLRETYDWFLKNQASYRE